MAKEKTFMELVAATFDEDGVQVGSAIGSDGKEYPDPVPMEPPVGYNAPPDIMTLIRSMVRSQEVMRLQDLAGIDTEEEANDFDLEDDPLDPLTPYEKVFEAPSGALAAGANGGDSQPTAAPPVEASKISASGGSVLETNNPDGNAAGKSDKPLPSPIVQK